MDREEYLKIIQKAIPGQVNMEIYYEYYKEHYKNPVKQDMFIKMFPIWLAHNVFTRINFDNVYNYFDSKFNINILSDSKNKVVKIF